jgi:hypothetical protein
MTITVYTMAGMDIIAITTPMIGAIGIVIHVIPVMVLATGTNTTVIIEAPMIGAPRIMAITGTPMVMDIHRSMMNPLLSFRRRCCFFLQGMEKT